MIKLCDYCKRPLTEEEAKHPRRRYHAGCVEPACRERKATSYRKRDTQAVERAKKAAETATAKRAQTWGVEKDPFPEMTIHGLPALHAWNNPFFG